MSAERFLVAALLASVVFCPLSWWAIGYDMRVSSEGGHWRPLLKRLYLGTLFALAGGVVIYAVPIPFPDWCATLDSWWWAFYGCWLA